MVVSTSVTDASVTDAWYYSASDEERRAFNKDRYETKKPIPLADLVKKFCAQPHIAEGIASGQLDSSGKSWTSPGPNYYFKRTEYVSGEIIGRWVYYNDLAWEPLQIPIRISRIDININILKLSNCNIRDNIQIDLEQTYKRRMKCERNKVERSIRQLRNHQLKRKYKNTSQRKRKFR